MVQLLKLEMEGFGKFDTAKTIEFSDGVNFVTGLNEAGKSTVLEAIMASIFKYTRAQIEPFLCWRNNDMCRTALTYKTADGKTFRITADYKSGKRRLEIIEKRKFKEISAVDKNIEPYLKEHFGFDDRKVFENTAFIRQSQMAILEDTPVRNRIKDMVEEVFAGRSEASATKALARINKIAKDSTKNANALSDKHKELEEKLKTAETTKGKLVADSLVYEETTKELEEKAQRLSKLKVSQKSFQEKESLTQEKNTLDEKIAKIDKLIASIRESLRRKDNVSEKLQAYKGYDKITDFEGINKSIKEIENNEASLNALQKTGKTKKVISEKYNRRYLALFVLGIALCIIVVGIPLVIYAYKRLKIREEKDVPDEEKISQMAQIEESIASTKRTITAKCASITDFNLRTFADNSLRYTQLLDERKHLSSSIREMSKSELERNEVTDDDEENIRKIEAKKTDYLNKLTITQNNLAKYRLLSFSQEDADEIDNLETRVDDLKRKQTELKTSIKTTTLLVESPEDIKEKLDANEDEKLTLERRAEEHELAAKFLALAEAEVQQKFTPAIEKKSKPLLKEITNQRYSDLKIEEETLDIAVKVPEIKDYVDVSYLSQGARDQLYFALRTVMSDLLGGDINIPLVLDDPFHNFDGPRLNKTIGTIKQLSKNKQIILISHRPYHEEFKDFCNNVVEL